MIYVKDHKQCDMFPPFEHLGPKRLALLESSWAPPVSGGDLAQSAGGEIVFSL